MGHSYDRARDRVYDSLLLLGTHSGHWRRWLRLNRFLLPKRDLRGYGIVLAPTHRRYVVSEQSQSNWQHPNAYDRERKEA